jgi:CheY-like chemotaxis protein/anti-sigma regulatory factor (Ser/Thr protein kinase)
MTREPVRATEPADAATTVLVVDDAAVDRRLAGAIVEQALGWRVVYADNGRTALAVLEKEKPSLVLTDLHMPEMDGLELVAAVRRLAPLVPVVLMTAFGNEEIALRALQTGAASYIPKTRLDDDAVPTLEKVLGVAHAERRQQRLLGSLTRAELQFALGNDTTLIPALIGHLQQYLVHLGLCDPMEKTRIGIALEEALMNAVHHGNLELSSELLREGHEPYRRLAAERRRQFPYQDRRVYCAAHLSGAEAVFVIRDEGPGFDPAGLPDPTDPANLEKVSGRGLLLIRTFMDAVTFNDKGNQITLLKRRAPAPEPA